MASKWPLSTLASRNTAITQRVPGSYSSVWRYIRRIEAVDPEVTLRVETPPGYEAQVDFGEVGLFRDPDTGQMRKTYAFVITLRYCVVKGLRQHFSKKLLLGKRLWV